VLFLLQALLGPWCGMYVTIADDYIATGVLLVSVGGGFFVCCGVVVVGEREEKPRGNGRTAAPVSKAPCNGSPSRERLRASVVDHISR